MIAFFSYHYSKAQTEINYTHCECKEQVNYSNNDNLIKNGDYLFTSNKYPKFKESGKYKDGKKDGIWIVKNPKGIVISSIEYSVGKLNGKYSLFFFEGEPKLNAYFVNNKPDKEWKYYNKKGGIIKGGSYDNGKAIGIWKVYDKRGKKIIAEYDFNTKQSVKTNDNPKIKKSYIPRDSESGGYIIIYYPKRKKINNNVPIGGNIYSNKQFIDLFNVPFVLMDGIVKYDFNVKGIIKDGVLNVKSIDVLPKSTFNPNMLFFPYIAITESKKNRNHISNSEKLNSKVKERVFETIMVLGPWISENSTEIEINVPFVLNKIKGL